MSGSDEIVLFDIPSKAPRVSWSLNPWKTRFVLNYKGLPYKTHWVEYPDIQPTLEKHLPPNKEGFAYSSPAIKLPDGTYVMDSRPIANKLESLYPSPPLHLDSPALAKLETIMPNLMPTLSGIYIPNVPKVILDSASHPHWYRTREAKFGNLDELEKTKGGEVAYNGAKPYLQEVTALLKEDTSGPYFLGTEVSYADFVWGGFLDFIGRVNQNDLDKLLEVSGDRDAHVQLQEGLREYRARNDH